MKATVLLGLLLSMPLARAESPPAETTPPRCTAPEYRQFDFWIGEWEVRNSKGVLAGHNRISRSTDGCRLIEHWRGASGFSGNSLNAWDRSAGVWRQFWVGSDGVVLRLQGGLRDGAMVMSGELPAAEGGVQLQRITWTPGEDGSVRQHWQTSDDDGATWTTVFLGVYRHPG